MDLIVMICMLGLIGLVGYLFNELMKPTETIVECKETTEEIWEFDNLVDYDISKTIEENERDLI